MNPDVQIAEQVQALALELSRRGLKVAVAESCTGGWIAKVITDLPGSSAWFDYGIVCYSNQVKHDLLGVSEQMLADSGAVSEVVAAAMATGALGRGSAAIAVAVTGVAGPDGGTIDKPVGTVCFAWTLRSGAVLTRRQQFAGERAAVRRQAVKHALDGLLEVLAHGPAA